LDQSVKFVKSNEGGFETSTIANNLDSMMRLEDLN